MLTPTLDCMSLSVAYGSVPVLHALDLAVAEGEAVALLGLSGSGKTTLLHAVAGFVPPSEGEIRIAGDLVSGPRRRVPPERRDLALVFQHYALWPHMTALETVAYPMRRRGITSAEAKRRAQQLLDRMGLAELAKRRPAELSGGQQQRVGLARALAREARLYLFDEPTAHLDAGLRASLQEELAERRRATGASALYSTHDASEALAVADRIAILRDGRIAQYGTPDDVYARPVDLDVARLTGPASVLDAAVEAVDASGIVARIGEHRIAIPGGGVDSATAALLVRPDWVKLDGSLPGTVGQRWYRGPHTDYRLHTPFGEVVVRELGSARFQIGERVGWRIVQAAATHR